MKLLINFNKYSKKIFYWKVNVHINKQYIPPYFFLNKNLKIIYNSILFISKSIQTFFEFLNIKEGSSVLTTALHSVF